MLSAEFQGNLLYIKFLKSELIYLLISALSQLSHYNRQYNSAVKSSRPTTSEFIFNSWLLPKYSPSIQSKVLPVPHSHSLSNVLFSYHFHILFYTSSCSQHTLLSPWKGSNLSISSAAQITFRYLVHQSTVNPNLSWITTKLLQAPSSLHRLWLTHFPNSISYFPT